MYTEKELIEIATIRLAVIQPAFNGTYPDRTKAAYYARIAATPLKLPRGQEVTYTPSTFSCWESDYRRNGFEGLVPKNRADRGGSRKLDDDAVAAIYRIHGQFPKINATQIYEKLVSEGIIGRTDVSLSTVQRFVKKHRIKGACSPNLKDRKAFEEEFACGMSKAMQTWLGRYPLWSFPCRRREKQAHLLHHGPGRQDQDDCRREILLPGQCLQLPKGS